MPDASVPGMRQPGNIDLANRPVVINDDGSKSTELSFSRGTDEGEVLVPQIVGGKKLSQDDAWQHYKDTGEHMGIFDSPGLADSYAEHVHNRSQGTPNASRKPQYVMPMNSSQKPSGYPILDKMQRRGLPLNRETYLSLDKWEPNPTLTAEEEATLPPQFRK
jgi:hypothetical protein